MRIKLFYYYKIMTNKLKMGNIIDEMHLDEMSLSDDFKKTILKYKERIIKYYLSLGFEQVDNGTIIDGIRDILIKNREYSGPKMDAVKRLITSQGV